MFEKAKNWLFSLVIVNKVSELDLTLTEAKALIPALTAVGESGSLELRKNSDGSVVVRINIKKDEDAKT